MFKDGIQLYNLKYPSLDPAQSQSEEPKGGFNKCLELAFWNTPRHAKTMIDFVWGVCPRVSSNRCGKKHQL